MGPLIAVSIGLVVAGPGLARQDGRQSARNRRHLMRTMTPAASGDATQSCAGRYQTDTGAVAAEFHQIDAAREGGRVVPASMPHIMALLNR